MRKLKKQSEKLVKHVNLLCTAAEREQWKKKAHQQMRSVNSWLRHLANTTNDEGVPVFIAAGPSARPTKGGARHV